jgi:leucine dehydrogenase
LKPQITAFENEGQRVVRFEDSTCGLSGVIAIDSLALGPATGGCRFWHYDDAESMLVDARRLARGMSYKNAMAGLPLGGGKSVIRRPHGRFDRDALFRSFARVLNSLGGDYLAAEDVGTTPHDMEVVRSVSPHVLGLPSNGTMAGGDPSPWTALGVHLCIEHLFSRRGMTLAGSRIAVQGLGSVGADLCRKLHESGATLVVADVHDHAVERLLADVPAQVVSPDAIHRSDVDLFAPCALGGGLNPETIPHIQASMVAGAANNQLATSADDDRLHARGILYAPDYVVNAGGIINVAAEYLGQDQREVFDRVGRIPARLSAVLERAQADKQPPSRVADAMARELIEAAVPLVRSRDVRAGASHL